MGKGSHLPDNEPTISSTEGEPPPDTEKGISKPEAAGYGVIGQEGFSKSQTTKTTTEADDEIQAGLERQRQRREQKPLYYCTLITKYPIRCFLVTLAGHISLVVISLILVVSGYDLLPLDFENLPLEIHDQPWLPRDLAWNHRNTFSEYYDRTPVTSYMSVAYPRSTVYLIYHAEGGNVFTKANLEKIQSIENRLVSVSGYSEYCQVDSGGSCQSPNSILRFFDGSLASIDAAFNDPTFSNIPTVLYTALNNNATKSDLQFFLSKSYEITSTTAHSDITRSSIPIGYPKQGYTDTESYEKLVRKFSSTYLKPVLEDIRENTNEFDVSYRSYLLWVDVVFDQAMKDVLCAVGSILFIFLCILFHTKSMWITGFAVLSIMTSFMGTNLIYRVVLDFRYIGFFHILTLFIVLGIGADDIFVFYDIWRNTAYESYPSLAHRLSDAYRKSVFSMLFTSLTTCVAFFSSAISPLLATRSFGVFSGIVITVNYLSVIIYFPTVIIMYHTKFEKFKWPCIRFLKKKYKENCACSCTSKSTETRVEDIHDGRKRTVAVIGDQVNKSHLRESESSTPTTTGYKTPMAMNRVRPDPATSSVGKSGTSNKAFRNDSDSSSSDSEVDDLETIAVRDARPRTACNVPKKRKKKSMMVRFFGTRYHAFVTHRVARWCILAVMAAVLAVFIYQATRLVPDNEGLKMLKESHVFRIADNHIQNSFVESDQDNTLIVYILWGLNQQDTSGCHFSTPKCQGKQSWDSEFDPSSPTSQTAMKSFCDTLFALPEEKANELRIRKDYTTGEYAINCYMTNFKTFLDAETASTSTDWGLTYDYTKAISFMDARTTYYDSSTFNSSYTDFLEIPISYWLSNKYTYNYTDDFYLFDHLIGEGTGTYTSTLKTNSAKKYGNDLRYVAVQVNTTIKYQTLGYVKGLPIMNKWEDFVNEQMKTMPAGINKGFQTTRFIWHWLVVLEMLSKNAVYGVVIGLSLAFPLLTIATMNIITGFLATFSICCSTVCVIGVIPVGGWKLGLIVSLNMCMVVGLTVDYVVHLAEGYTMSLRKDRLSRVQDMLDEMAVSIFFGACTTLGASLFMFLAQLSFFFQFGIFMFSTILFSLFFSMGMFVTLMGIFGPQGDTGNIRVAARRLRDWCRNRRKKT